MYFFSPIPPLHNLLHLHGFPYQVFHIHFNYSHYPTCPSYATVTSTLDSQSVWGFESGMAKSMFPSSWHLEKLSRRKIVILNQSALVVWLQILSSMQFFTNCSALTCVHLMSCLVFNTEGCQESLTDVHSGGVALDLDCSANSLMLSLISTDWLDKSDP